MTKKSLKLRNVVAIAICLAVTTMCFGCGSKDKDKDNNNGNGGNPTAVAITLDLLKGANDNEIIVKCTPKAPWVDLKNLEGTGFPACYFNRSGSFYVATKTGGTATQIMSSMHTEGAGWNSTATEYTYVFESIGGDWEGTVILAPVDQQYLKEIKIEDMGVKSITIGKNDPVSLKLGD